jgi:glucokinase
MDLQQTLTSNIKKYRQFILSADIGGTNTRFGIMGIGNNTAELLAKYSFKTKWIHFCTKVVEIVENAKKTYGIELSGLSAGAAGKIENNEAMLTNIDRKISSEEILRETPIKNVILMNDFEASAYGVNSFDLGKETTLVIGAGTGLGKAVLVRKENFYTPLASEGGHAEMPFYEEDKKLLKFIMKKRKLERLTWEDLLSGRGLEDINEFLTKKQTPAPRINNAESFEIFSKFFGRCCRNFALEVLCQKIYVTGAIALNHPEIIRKMFRKELEKGVFRHYLKGIKVEIITDENIGLLGAGYAWLMQNPPKN